MRMQKEDGRIEEYTGCSSNRAILYKEINQTYKINLFHETLRFRESRVQRFVKYVQTRLITDWVRINNQQEKIEKIELERVKSFRRDDLR